jgi:hypothetical protein
MQFDYLVFLMYMSIVVVFWESSPSFHNAVRYTNVNGLIEIPVERCVVQKLLKVKLRNWTNKTMAGLELMFNKQCLDSTEDAI